MFSENHKISSRQLQALLLTDWMGKMLLLFPAAAGRAGGRSALAGLLAGGLLVLELGCLILRKRRSRQGSYYGCLKGRLGGLAAGGVYVLGILYFLYHSALMLYLCGRIAVTYLIPEADFRLVTLTAAGLGLYLALGGMEVRGRVSELTAFFVWGLFFLMILLAMTSFRPEQMALDEKGLKALPFAGCTAAVLPGFGTLGILPVVKEQVEDPENMKKRCGQAVAMTIVLLFFTFLACFGIFGAEGMRRLAWPVISLMSSASLNGVFLQRWDILLIGFLEFSLFLSVGEGVFYGGVLAGELAGPKRQKMNRKFMTAAAAAAWLLCLGMNAYREVLLWGGAVSFLVCAPLLLAAALWMSRGGRRKKRRKTGKMGLAVFCLTLFLFLTGCSARELETRAFPLALEVGALEGDVVLACAWPDTKGSADSSEEKGQGLMELETEPSGEGEEKVPDELTFPVNDASLTAVRAESIREAVKQVQNLQDRYVDYSQVKAILWDVSLRNEPELAEEILEWLESSPSFARNILVFRISSEELTLGEVQEQSRGQAGAYLENLYRNNPDFQENVRTLEEVLYVPERKR